MNSRLLVTSTLMPLLETCASSELNSSCGHRAGVENTNKGGRQDKQDKKDPGKIEPEKDLVKK